MKGRYPMTFVDLFAGLGGFHQGMKKAGFKCIFASELIPHLRVLYEKNHGVPVHGDLTKINAADIPKHSLLCAGFPCQSFSLAGSKQGSQCGQTGRLIDHVVKTVKHHKPEFLLLENVPNILKIENGDFWNYIKAAFGGIGYTLTHKVISPNDIGIPQNRKRIFILGSRDNLRLNNFKWPSLTTGSKASLADILDPSLPYKTLESDKSILLKHWQYLLNYCSIDYLPSVSIAAPEFGANYPIDFKHKTLKQMRRYRGKYGVSLARCTNWKNMIGLLPGYVNDKRQVPDWMIKSVKYSRGLYKNNRVFLSDWMANLNKDYNSWQILEWRGHRDDFRLSNHIIQFRPSGIRVMKGQQAPSLIAMTPTQIPIIGSQMRYMSKYEAARLQHLHSLKILPDNNTQAFSALGNAVNARIVELIGRQIRQIL